jgi:hypothetical protein
MNFFMNADILLGLAGGLLIAIAITKHKMFTTNHWRYYVVSIAVGPLLGYWALAVGAIGLVIPTPKRKS